ncbi:MAG: hypothetical protein DRI89_11875, partial [Bacteroidetes bacterium]
MKLKTLVLLFTLFIFSSLSAQDKNISNGEVFDGEPFLSINPNNSQHMVVAWMGWKWLQRIVIKTKVSFNAGVTWSEAVEIPHVNSSFTSADPSLAFDQQGNIFLTYVDYNKLIDSGGVYIRKSTNGGMNWEEAVQVIDMHTDAGKKAIDRPWIRIDRSTGSTQGTIYVSTMNAKGATSPFNPYLSRSTDEGQSWDAWRYIDTTGWLSGYFIAQPMPTADVSANGTFHCIYPSWVLSQNLMPLYIHASLDNESGSFNYHTVYESADNVSDSLSKKGYLLLANPADENHLAFIFLSKPAGDADVFLTESFNSGENWSAPIRVNDDPIGNGRMQDLLWADYDEDGDLVVSWRDRRNAADSGYTVASEIWGATLWKDSTEFSVNFRISDTLVAYDSVLAKSGNDFMCIVLQSDTLNAVWGDTRDSSLNIWMKRIVLPGAGSVGISLIASERIPLVDVYPNPFSNSTT